MADDGSPTGPTGPTGPSNVPKRRRLAEETDDDEAEGDAGNAPSQQQHQDDEDANDEAAAGGGGAGDSSRRARLEQRAAERRRRRLQAEVADLNVSYPGDEFYRGADFRRWSRGAAPGLRWPKGWDDIQLEPADIRSGYTAHNAEAWNRQPVHTIESAFFGVFDIGPRHRVSFGGDTSPRSNGRRLAFWRGGDWRQPGFLQGITTHNIRSGCKTASREKPEIESRGLVYARQNPEMEEVPDPNVLGDEPMDADPNDGDPDLSDNNGEESDGDYIDENVDDAAAVLLGSSGRVRDEDEGDGEDLVENAMQDYQPIAALDTYGTEGIDDREYGSIDADERASA
ncbi:hypothetical protein THAOC_03391, partial [Thalassiosira oceanica]